MASRRLSARFIAKVAAIDVAVFLAFDVLFASATHLIRARVDPSARWLDAFFEYLPAWAGWALVAPIIFMVSEQQRVGPGRGLRPIAIHVALGLVITPLVSLFWYVVDLALAGGGLGELPTLIAQRWRLSTLDLQWYGWIALAAHAYYGTRDAIARAGEAATLQVEIAELSSRLVRAELDALKAQLHPHFLFNTHNAIAGLIRAGESAAALELLVHLGDFLRHTLESGRHASVPLARELGFVEKYLAIQQIRFRDRLRVEWDVDAACKQFMVPSLLLQPLIENAVHHGVSAERDDNFVRIRGRMNAGQLEFEIHNSTVEAAEDQRGFGIGLENVHARLRRIHADAYSLVLELVSPEHMRLVMTLPASPRGALDAERPRPAGR